MPIKVLVVDDQDIVRWGVQAILNTDPRIEVVGEASSGAAAVSEIRGLSPDVVLLDIQLGDVTGLEVLAHIRGLDHQPKVIIMTTFNTDGNIVEAMNLGASGFLLKGSGREEILSAVHAVGSGGTFLSPTVAARLTSLASRSHAFLSLEVSDRIADLKDREIEILARLGRGSENAAIARELHLSEASVKTYVSRILDKLGVSNRTQAALIAHQSGLVARDE